MERVLEVVAQWLRISILFRLNYIIRSVAWAEDISVYGGYGNQLRKFLE